MAEKVLIREVAPRDGFQSIAEFISIENKLKIIAAIAEAGVRDIEVTSFVSPKSIPQLRDAEEVIRLSQKGNVTYSALVPNLIVARNASQLVQMKSSWLFLQQKPIMKQISGVVLKNHCLNLMRFSLWQ